MATVGGKISSEDEGKPKEAVALAGEVDQFSLVESEFQVGRTMGIVGSELSRKGKNMMVIVTVEKEDKKLHVGFLGLLSQRRAGHLLKARGATL